MHTKLSCDGEVSFMKKRVIGIDKVIRYRIKRLTQVWLERPTISCLIDLISKTNRHQYRHFSENCNCYSTTTDVPSDRFYFDESSSDFTHVCMFMYESWVSHFYTVKRSGLWAYVYIKSGLKFTFVNERQ